MSGQNIIALCSACAIAVTGLAIPLPAAAQPITVTGPSDEERITRRVSYRDLDLTLARDEQRLVRRVGFAVSRVCPNGLGYLLTVRQCQSFAWNGARPQMALAVERARQIAANGFSSIAPVAIVIAVQ